MSNEFNDWKRDEIIEQLLEHNLTDAIKYIEWLERKYWILKSDKERQQGIINEYIKG